MTVRKSSYKKSKLSKNLKTVSVRKELKLSFSLRSMGATFFAVKISIHRPFQNDANMATFVDSLKWFSPEN